jgi:hypothetical protein
MRDQLLDIVEHTHKLGDIELVKVIGDTNETIVNAVNEGRSVVVNAKFNDPLPDFIGTFGMPELGKLNTILRISEYAEDAKISINKKDDGEPSGIHFENKTGDFKNDFRFMSSVVVNEKLKTTKFKGANWSVTFEPNAIGIQRLVYQIQANSGETSFQAKTEDNNLVFYFGNHSSHAGNFVFQHGVTGSLTTAWSWPLEVFKSILSLSGDKIVRFSNDGAAQITIASGIATWDYTILAQTK